MMLRVIDVDRRRVARKYELCGLPIGAKAVRMGRLDAAPELQEAAARRIARQTRARQALERDLALIAEAGA